MQYKWLGLAFLFFLPAYPVLADSFCDHPPPEVLAYLGAHPEWKLMTLDPGDPEDWWQDKKRDCPGFTFVDMDGKGYRYAVLVNQRAGKRVNQQLVLLAAGANPEMTLHRTQGQGFSYIGRLNPGAYQDQFDLRKIRLPHDGVWMGALDAGAQGFYFAGSKLRQFTYSE